jgi:hypothetical protein
MPQNITSGASKTLPQPPEVPQFKLTHYIRPPLLVAISAAA